MSSAAPRLRRLKTLLAEPPVYGANVAATNYTPDGLRFLRTSDISSRGEIHDGTPVYVMADEIRPEHILDDGDLLISRSGTVGRCALYSNSIGPCTHAGYLVRLRLRDDVNKRFMWYTTQSSFFAASIQQDTIQSTIGNFNAQRMGDLRVPLPDLVEQQAIVRFLDEETAKLDAVIEKNAKSVEMAAAARDSRAAILFPQQDLKPMRRVISEICDGPFGSNLKSEHYASQGARVIRLQNISAGDFLDKDKAYVGLEHFDQFRRHEAKEDDLLVAGLGDENNGLGRACLVPRNLGIAMVKADCFRLRLNPTLALHSYVMHYLNSPPAEPETIWHSRGATRLRMNSQGIAAIRIPLPSLSEQKHIVGELNELHENVRSMRLKLRASIQVLKEYRAALITAAVTGQIDVSGAA